MKRFLLFASLLFSLSLFAQKQSTIAGNRDVEWVYGSARRPVLIFLPGTGEAKSQFDSYDALYKHGPAKFLKQTTWRPQYLNIYCVQSPTPFFDLSKLDDIVNEIAAKPTTDTNRIYVTGLSAGAIMWGRWLYSSQSRANKIAAFVSLSGEWPGASVSNLKNVAVRAIYGDADRTVKTYTIKNAVVEAQKEGMKNKQYYVKPGGHDARFWATFYDPSIGIDGKTVYRWVVQFSRPAIQAKSKRKH